MQNVRLSVNNLNKSFSVPVLVNVSLSISGGEIHSIVGENGAGKTTLVHILAGLLAKDGGEVLLDGALHNPADARDALNAGVSFVAQELSIIGTLSAAENIFFGNLPRRRSVILRDELNGRARHSLDRVGLRHVAPEMLAGELGLAERQLLELAKALATDCRLLLLDEPTSALSAEQADRLHEVVAELAAGGTSIIYISHRLEDVLQISNNVTVLRDGQIVASAPAAEMSVEDMMRQMAGREAGTGRRPRDRSKSGAIALDVRGITTDYLQNPISLTCETGEIVGVAGLAGAGKSELLEALFGLVPLSDGSVVRFSDGDEIPIGNAGQAVNSGIGYLGEDRQSMGLISGQSVLSNITLPSLTGFASGIGVIAQSHERAAGRRFVDQLTIRCDGLDQNIDQLSGGNQQKALIARWLLCDADLLLLDEPTRGIDVGTKDAIYELLLELQRKGKTIIVASSEIEELMAVCDRVLVLSDRKLITEFSRDNWTEEDILAAAFAGFAPRSLPTASADQQTGKPVRSN